MRKRLLGMVLASFLLLSCSLSPEQEATARSFTLPDLTLRNATYVLDRGNEPPISVIADEIDLYDQTHKAIIRGLHFSQKDKEGNIIISGHADYAEVDTEYYDAELSGSISLEKYPEHLIIEAEALSWIGDDETLVSRGDTPVTLLYEDNKKVQGTGMTATLASFSVTFKTVLEGVISQ
nr:LPS export ABC transporter periplasmic protein LptC [uncultured Sphaerochaeta sp.]